MYGGFHLFSRIRCGSECRSHLGFLLRRNPQKHPSKYPQQKRYCFVVRRKTAPTFEDVADNLCGNFAFRVARKISLMAAGCGVNIACRTGEDGFSVPAIFERVSINSAVVMGFQRITRELIFFIVKQQKPGALVYRTFPLIVV